MKLLAPLRGWLAPLSEVPDPVFAGQMLGDGIAIDPTGDTLYSPCSGEIVSIAPTQHAITISADNGAQILVHLGLETVLLKGDGFTAFVRTGQRVKAGERLIGFDLDLIARRARSLITPILIVNTDCFKLTTAPTGREIEVGEVLLELKSRRAATITAASSETVQHTVSLSLPHGLHARPAGKIASMASTYAAEIKIGFGHKSADARSPVELMTLGAEAGSALVLSAQGADARRAVKALAAFLTSNGGENVEPSVAAPYAPPTPASLGVLQGVKAAPGLVVGQAWPLERAVIVVVRDGEGGEVELEALSKALKNVMNELSVHGVASDITAAHRALLNDPRILAGVKSQIANGRSAAFAWGAVMDEQAGALYALTDPRLRDRAQDMIDLKRRVQRALGGVGAEAAPAPEGAILLADDLLPSELLALGKRIGGIVTARGGPTSHVAIIAASLGLPALVAVGERALSVQAGAMVILDADAGELRTQPSEDQIFEAQARQVHLFKERAEALLAAGAPGTMADGTRIEIFANLGHLDEAAPAVAAGAEGCGLLRTEFLFSDRAHAPGEEEQRLAYQAIAAALEARPLIIRTLDIGGDKPAPYLSSPFEENPALGLRGVRQSLRRPDLLHTQLRAILGVRPLGQCRIMVPMITDLEELRAVRRALETAKAELGVNHIVELGVMVETPAAALIAEELAREADFLSIGTNDLTQYTLAMDRGNPAVAVGVDALHPAVLRLIALTCKGSLSAGKWTGMCGGLASDPLAAPLLIGLGVTELSAAPGSVARVKAAVRPLDLKACRALAKRALAEPSASDVRALLEASR